MKKSDVIRAWGKILRGRRPFLSLEITRECPLRCPGCYAYEPAHLGPAGPLRQLGDLSGDALVTGVLSLIRRLRPLHLSIVGGEPLVRYRELDLLLPKILRMGVEVQLVTSAVRRIPLHWRDLSDLHIVVSVDGLPPEHDRRRAPATYERILQNIAGHSVIVHCTITRQHCQKPGYFREFAEFWSSREEVRKIWFSLFTPQKGDASAERLRPEDRVRTLAVLAELRGAFSKIDMPVSVLAGFRDPPHSPQECVFAQTTSCFSADLATRIEPCQFGGDPVCAECGCMASAGFASVAKHKLAGLVPVSDVFTLSRNIGRHFAGIGA